ncbi:hypothetical protein KUV22_02770 [Microbulbifer agarilyticus]|uniref:hypothetical protein n=1 Tax=Microbulbifer agarilyticus TaxID=260552 RepID=UPI001C968C5E|nr:hypothetical protein [Microbulbifer agarilyticus]MBY6189331.1 hypothetical protein [Microbulbifer agarilyticus]
MTKYDAVERIRKSIDSGAQVITPKGLIYEKYVESQTQFLLDHVIEPVQAKVTSACFPEYDFENYKNSEVWCIARSGNSWLLHNVNENEFALGFGESEASISMLGFSSPDALAEWLG